MTTKSITFRSSLRGHVVGSKRMFITRYTTGGVVGWIDTPSHPVEVEPPNTVLTIPTSRLLEDQWAVAYELVESFYGLFDAPPALIPFATDRRVDVSALSRI